MEALDFEKEYSRLNKAQKEAVDQIEGPVMVVAGPGTGKTQILTLRIANILKITDTPADGILALTFTESGVSSMRKRLSQMIGSRAYSVNISTFHGFCNDVIKQYPHYFPKIIGAENITEVEQIDIIQKVLEESKLIKLKPFGNPLHYIPKIKASINILKREGVSPEFLDAVIKKEEEEFNQLSDLYYTSGPHKGKMKGAYKEKLEDLEKTKEILEIFSEYQKRLELNRLYDFADMISQVVGVLEENNDLLLSLQEKYLYILVDEHQDTNNAQNRLIELLCNFYPNPNIFVVGDEKQAIYRFQGASLENFLYFKERYPMAKLIILDQNYRSTQPILDAAHSLIAGKRPLVSNSEINKTQIDLCVFTHPDAENYFIATDIRNRLEKGVLGGQIAVLFRDNRDAFLIAHMLEKIGVSFVIESDQNLLDDLQIKKIIQLIRAINDFGSQDVFLEAMHIDFFNIPPLDIYKVLSFADKNKISSLDIARNANKHTDLNFENPKALESFYQIISRLSILEKNATLPEFFETLVRESGILPYILNLSNNAEILEKINVIFDQIRDLSDKHKGYSLKDFINYIDTILSHNLLIKNNALFTATNFVRLMTAHKSKGQEFEYVYITNAFDGHWGNKKNRGDLYIPPRAFSISGRVPEDQNQLDDERRLFYVALTRAKKEVIITYSKQSTSGREQLPSQFVEEIDKSLIAQVDTKIFEDSFAEKKEILFTPTKSKSVNVTDKEFIASIFLKNGLSVTGLNNFLKCPWNYFYTNLLRLPKAKSKHQMYGTAVHGALKDFFMKLKDGKVGKEYLLEKFNFYLQNESFNKNDLDEAKNKGEKSLSGYFDIYNGGWPTNTIVEQRISGILLTPEIKLTGQIDKIELEKDGVSVNVVDYKTGKPKSRGEIEGSSSNSNGDIKRQLVFYNLLLNLYENGKYKMIGGDIDFIEPNERGYYKKEHFDIDQKEVLELQEIIKDVSNQILNLTFWDSQCDDKECEYCQIRRMMS